MKSSVKKAFLTFIAIALSVSSFGQVGIGTELPNASSILEISSITQGVLMPRMTTSQRDAIATPANGLVVINVDTDCINYYTSSANSWFEVCGKVPAFSCGDPTVLVEVTNPITGDIWMDRDLGAYQQATSSQDTASFGYLYQWGRFTDGHQCRNSTTTTTNATSSTPNDGNVWDEKFITEPNNPQDWLVPQDNTLWQGLNGTNNPCPVGFRIPTIIELEAERLSWASSDRAGAYDSPLKFAVGGFRATTGNILTVGANTYNWSSTVIGTESYYLFSTNSTAGTYDDASRANGMGIRCIKD